MSPRHVLAAGALITTGCAAPDYVANKIADILLRRHGTEADMVNAVLWLASTASSLVTGHTLLMDGGLSLR